ncbi:FMN-dependent NADH-azoreductase [Salipiger mucosus]|uniref:FMN dependent NADH:quinone oxidoreductase n=1 Tax=Salipiger mucosus DSM 16094 TaxID=1123237 RepID=S9Q9S1_9RHOB|nr:NAD(P)H-dependent oxidoreductase [Salipiger mucosus]EPX76388.1 FMN-dependent NADH-azoreductase [Salipiger mucosus DSM 16094]
MTTLLRIDASARRSDNPMPQHNSISRQLADTFVGAWEHNLPETGIIERDLGLAPPDFISQAWIAAVFRPESERSPTQRALLTQSDTMIDELRRADIVVLSTPMYNYGMPAALKAWFDQIVRIGETFTFDLDRGDYPLEPILSGKTLVLLTSSGEFGFAGGGMREAHNHLAPHIRTLGPYLGASQIIEIGAEYQEFGGKRHAASVREAHEDAREAAERLAREVGTIRPATVAP